MDAAEDAKDANSDKGQGLPRRILGAVRAEGDCPTAGGYRWIRADPPLAKART
jgi:hypothetical protein